MRPLGVVAFHAPAARTLNGLPSPTQAVHRRDVISAALRPGRPFFSLRSPTSFSLSLMLAGKARNKPPTTVNELDRTLNIRVVGSSFRTKQTKALIRDLIRRIEAYLPRSIRRGRQKSLEASVVVVLIIKASLGKGTHKILSNGRRCGVLGTNRV